MEPFKIQMGGGWGMEPFKIQMSWSLGYGALHNSNELEFGVWSPSQFKWVGVGGMEPFIIQMGGG